jgi:hypothetical protein
VKGIEREENGIEDAAIRNLDTKLHGNYEKEKRGTK